MQELSLFLCTCVRHRRLPEEGTYRSVCLCPASKQVCFEVRLRPMCVCVCVRVKSWSPLATLLLSLSLFSVVLFSLDFLLIVLCPLDERVQRLTCNFPSFSRIPPQVHTSVT